MSNVFRWRQTQTCLYDLVKEMSLGTYYDHNSLWHKQVMIAHCPDHLYSNLISHCLYANPAGSTNRAYT